MDDFEKDESLTESGETANTDINADEKLKEELEELKDTFQAELDKATSQAENSDEIAEADLPIQELDEISEEDENSETNEKNFEGKLCECCGEEPASEKYGEDYPYCDKCRDLMKKYPMRASGIIMAIVMVIVAAAGIYFSAGYIDDYTSILAADEAYYSGKMMTAMTNYGTYISSLSANEKPSKKVLGKLIKGYTSNGYYGDASDLIETYFSESSLSMPWNKKYQKILDDYDSLTTTYYKIDEIMGDILDGSKDYDYDEVMAELDALINKSAETETTETTTESAKETSATKTSEDESSSDLSTTSEETTESTPVVYNEIFVEYYKYVLMSLHGESYEDQMAQLEKVDNMDDELEWIYLTNMISVAAKLGDTEKAEKYFNRVISVNKEDSSAYTAYASTFRFTETPDPDKMIEICKEAEANAYNGDTSYKTSLAIANLLKGDGEAAMEIMEEVINSGSYTVQSCNLYALTSLYVGDKDNYDDMKTLLENNNYEISSLVTKYKNGKISLEKVLTDNGGEI